MADQRELKIGVLAGDGIGPEITDAPIEVLPAASELTGLKLRLFFRGPPQRQKRLLNLMDRSSAAGWIGGRLRTITRAK